ncbi:MAG: VanZ family protein [Thermoguttaceae bacterium]|nr:VanZ family protein [Thermoguttaceae bacterium]MDW8078249.1 VanZ family protein [Thermoguttaceae bacterium]
MSEPFRPLFGDRGNVRLFRVLATVYVVVLTIGLLAPHRILSSVAGIQLGQGGDRLQHVVAFAILATLVMRAEWTKTLVGTFLLLFVYAISMELVQAITPWRLFDLGDIAANLVGIGGGMLLAAAYLRRFQAAKKSSNSRA